MSNSDADGLLNSEPPTTQSHPKNRWLYFCRLLAKWRNTLPKERRGREVFGKHVIAKYCGEAAHRNTIMRLENGSFSVNAGVIVSYLEEMGLMPDVLSVMAEGHAPTMSYMMLVQAELKGRIRQEQSDALKKLKKIRSRELPFGVSNSEYE